MYSDLSNEECYNCFGSGSSKDICPECNGVASKYNAAHTETCPTCNGDGFIEKACRTCNGSGHLEQEENSYLIED